MKAQAAVDPAGGDIIRDLDQLRTETLKLTAVGTVALALAVGYFAVYVTDRFDLRSFLFVWGIILVAAAAYWALRFDSTVACGVLAGGFAANLVAALFVSRQGLLVFWFAPTVIVSGALLGWRSGVFVGALATVAVVAGHSWAGFVADDVAIHGLLVAWIGLPVSWLLSHPTRTMLHWAWHSYEVSRRTTEELRDRQAELLRTVKSLNLAYERLEHLNAELARSRQVAEHARQLKADFAAAVSHELRTPLNLIIGFAEMMVKNAEVVYGERLPLLYRKDVESIYRNASHIASLADDILDLSQIDAHRMGLHKTRCSLVEVVDEALSAIRGLFEDKGLYLRVDLPPDLPEVYADPTRVRQILLNLLINAARYTDDGGVSIVTRCEEREVVVSVIDTGVGIAEEDLPHVFEEFYQGRGPGQRRGKSGLGLAVTKRFVELQGGNMWVQSTPGQGSSFSLSLPLCTTVVATSYTSDSDVLARVPAAGPPERTLAVLDRSLDHELARVLQRYLDGFQVVPVKSVREAKQLAESGGLSVLVIANGTSAVSAGRVQRVQDEFPTVPSVFCSLRPNRTPGGQMGVRGYLRKPVTRQQIQTTLQSFGRRVRDVLVVDDDPEMVRLLAQMVRTCSRHYRVSQAGGGAESLRLMHEARPDAVLLDLLMPDVDGYAVLESMRGDDSLRTVPVVVVTAHGYEDWETRVDLLGITRSGGLTVAEGTRCLQASLGALLQK